MTYIELLDHLDSCIKKQKKCPLNCGEPIAGIEPMDHYDTCPNALVECKICDY